MVEYYYLVNKSPIKSVNWIINHSHTIDPNIIWNWDVGSIIICTLFLFAFSLNDRFMDSTHFSVMSNGEKVYFVVEKTS